MADEDKKPRHRLGADELLEETHRTVGKIVSLLESNGLAAESVEHITTLAKGLDFMVNSTVHLCMSFLRLPSRCWQTRTGCRLELPTVALHWSPRVASVS